MDEKMLSIPYLKALQLRVALDDFIDVPTVFNQNRLITDIIIYLEEQEKEEEKCTY